MSQTVTIVMQIKHHVLGSGCIRNTPSNKTAYADCFVFEPASNNVVTGPAKEKIKVMTTSTPTVRVELQTKTNSL